MPIDALPRMSCKGVRGALKDDFDLDPQRGVEGARRVCTQLRFPGWPVGTLPTVSEGARRTRTPERREYRHRSASWTGKV